MVRKVRVSAVYQGLFLMAFALYAGETRKRIEAPPSDASKAAVLSEVESGQEAKEPLEELYQDLLEVPVFQGNIQGVSLERSTDGIFIKIESDELYRSEAVEVEPVWHSSLEQIGHQIQARAPGLGLELQITGFGPKAGSRARWIADYFKNQLQEPSSLKIRLFASDQRPWSRLWLRAIINGE